MDTLLLDFANRVRELNMTDDEQLHARRQQCRSFLKNCVELTLKFNRLGHLTEPEKQINFHLGLHFYDRADLRNSLTYLLEMISLRDERRFEECEWDSKIYSAYHKLNADVINALY